MTQVAVCTINDCGVLAIGRCASCTNAFCQSHQARYVGSRLPYASLCSSCLARSEANEKHRLDLIQADKDYIHGKAKDELRKSGISTVDVYEKRWESRHSILGGSKTVDTITLIGDGWLLGEFVWVVTIRHPGSHFEGTEDRFEEKGVSDPTVLLSNGGLVRVHKVAGRDGYFITNDHATLHDSWKLVAAAIRELIAGS